MAKSKAMYASEINKISIGTKVLRITMVVIGALIFAVGLELF